MSVIDIVILVVFAAAAIIGFMEGAVRQIGSIAGWIIGLFAARVFGPPVAQAIMAARTTEELQHQSLMSDSLSSMMGSVVVFLAVFILVFVIVRLLRGLIHGIGLGPVDRLAGAAVSVLKWFVGVSLILNILWFFWPQCAVFSDSTIGQGRVMDIIMQLFPWLMGIVGFN